MDAPSPPRDSSEYRADKVASDVFIEEETFSWYNPDRFPSVRIGEVLESRYQVLVKLGYGSVSTAWLCRDLEAHQYVTLKVFMTGHRQTANEANVLKHLDTVQSKHPGSGLIRRMLDTFELPGVGGAHVCIIHEPLSLSLRGIRDMAGGQIPAGILKPMIYGMLLGLDYLHSEAQVVHTDIQEGNIMLSINDTAILDEIAAEEWREPSPCKISGERVIHTSVEIDIPDDPGQPLICDFGDAKIGKGPFVGEVMPDLYRAPEIVLAIPWDEKIDIWGFGMMVWDLLQGKHLFTERLPSRESSIPMHLARMVGLMGPPSRDFLAESSVACDFFDENGRPRPGIDIPDTSLEAEDGIFSGEEKEKFLTFMRRMLQWRPADRSSARELLDDPWLQSFGWTEQY